MGVGGMHDSNLSTCDMRQEVFNESKASLGYRLKPCLKRNKQKLRDG